MSAIDNLHVLSTRALGKSLGYLLLCIFTLEAIVPLGCMPSRVSQGQWVDICPVKQSMLADLVKSSHHHQNHDHSSDKQDNSLSSKSVCDWGSGVQVLYTLAFASVITLVVLPQNLPFIDKSFRHRSAFRLSGNRDPPLINVV